jgi:hypothetical protein
MTQLKITSVQDDVTKVILQIILVTAKRGITIQWILRDLKSWAITTRLISRSDMYESTINLWLLH